MHAPVSERSRTVQSSTEERLLNTTRALRTVRQRLLDRFSTINAPSVAGFLSHYRQRWLIAKLQIVVPRLRLSWASAAAPRRRFSGAHSPLHWSAVAPDGCSILEVMRNQGLTSDALGWMRKSDC